METLRRWLTTALIFVIACAVLYIAARPTEVSQRIPAAVTPQLEPATSQLAELQPEVDLVLADGIVGTKWGATIAEAQAAIGGGIVADDGRRLWFYSGQDLFRAARGERDMIELFFNDAGFWRIRIEYPNCVEIGYALRSTFGEPSEPGHFGDAGVWRGNAFELEGLRGDNGVCHVTIERH